MKSIISMILVVSLMLMVSGPVMAQNAQAYVTQSVSTNTVDGDDFVWGANALVISSNTVMPLLYNITISNSNWQVPQVVTFYDGFNLNESSANVSIFWQVELSSAATANLPFQEAFPPRYPLRADNGVAIRKSSTGSTVRVSFTAQ